MKFSRQCRLFIFAILIGLAAVLLPHIAAAKVNVLTCGKTSFRLDLVEETVALRGTDGTWGEKLPLRVSHDAFRWEVRGPATPQFTDYYLIDRKNLEFTYRRCSGNDCAGGEAICLNQTNRQSAN